MSTQFWPHQWHSRFATLYGAYRLLDALRHSGSAYEYRELQGLSPFLLLWFVALSKVIVVYLVATVLDNRYPGDSVRESSLRMIAPILALGVLSLLADISTTTRSTSFTVLGWAVLVASSYLYTRSQRSSRALTPPTQPAWPLAVAPVGRTYSGPGPVQWPSEPPNGTEPADLGFSIEPIADRPGPAQRTTRGLLHRASSVVIALAWLPLGAVFLYALNYCPDTGAETATAVVSLAIVGIQLLGNPCAGWLLDRRYGRSGGAFLAFGRCLLVAVALAGVSLVLLFLIPDGVGNYCG